MFDNHIVASALLRQHLKQHGHRVILPHRYHPDNSAILTVLVMPEHITSIIPCFNFVLDTPSRPSQNHDAPYGGSKNQRS